MLVQDDCAHGHLAVVGFPACLCRDDFGQQCHVPAGVPAAGAGLAAAAVLAGLFHPQGFQSGRAGHAVCGQAVFLLEGRTALVVLTAVTRRPPGRRSSPTASTWSGWWSRHCLSPPVDSWPPGRTGRSPGPGCSKVVWCKAGHTAVFSAVSCSRRLSKMQFSLSFSGFWGDIPVKSWKSA